MGSMTLLNLELWRDVTAMWVLGNEHDSLGRLTSALNRYSISLAPYIFFCCCCFNLGKLLFSKSTALCFNFYSTHSQLVNSKYVLAQKALTRNNYFKNLSLCRKYDFDSPFLEQMLPALTHYSKMIMLTIF